MTRPIIKVNPRPMDIVVKGIHALAESTEASDADEIYVLTTVIDLTAMPIPNLRTTLTGPWTNVDAQETHKSVLFPPSTSQDTMDTVGEIGVVVGRPVWGPDGNPQLIGSPDDVIILVTVMEHDAGIPNAMRATVQSQATAALAGSIGLPRAAVIDQLRTAIDDATQTPITRFPPDPDNIVQRTKELRLTHAPIAKSAVGEGHEQSVFFFGGNNGEGHFRVDYACRPKLA
jgi:hypothetical protein